MYYFVEHGDFDALLKLEGFSGDLGEVLEKIAQRHGLDFSGVRAAATWLIAGLPMNWLRQTPVAHEMTRNFSGSPTAEWRREEE